MLSTDSGKGSLHVTPLLFHSRRRSQNLRWYKACMGCNRASPIVWVTKNGVTEWKIDYQSTSSCSLQTSVPGQQWVGNRGLMLHTSLRYSPFSLWYDWIGALGAHLAAVIGHWELENKVRQGPWHAMTRRVPTGYAKLRVCSRKLQTLCTFAWLINVAFVGLRQVVIHGSICLVKVEPIINV
jgi:hypothetical protein